MDELLKTLMGKIVNERAIIAALLFGSYARRCPTNSSDLDFQIVTRRTRLLSCREWLACDGRFDVIIISNRRATGGAIKLTILFSNGLVDMVLPRYFEIIAAKFLVRMRAHCLSGGLYRRLGALAIIIRPGYEIIKGSGAWARFFDIVAREIHPTRIDNRAIAAIANRCYVDAYWAYNKAKEGELLAAQRWLHRVPFDASLELLNEWRLRRNLKPCYDARRAESYLTPCELALVRVETILDRESLCQASIIVVDNMRKLVRTLTGQDPMWPKFRE